MYKSKRDHQCWEQWSTREKNTPPYKRDTWEAFIQSQHSQNCIPNSASLDTSVQVDLRFALIDVKCFTDLALPLLTCPVYDTQTRPVHLMRRLLSTKRLVNLFVVTGELGTFCHIMSTQSGSLKSYLKLHVATCRFRPGAVPHSPLKKVSQHVCVSCIGVGQSASPHVCCGFVVCGSVHEWRFLFSDFVALVLSWLCC